MLFLFTTSEFLYNIFYLSRVDFLSVFSLPGQKDIWILTSSPASLNPNSHSRLHVLLTFLCVCKSWPSSTMSTVTGCPASLLLLPGSQSDAPQASHTHYMLSPEALRLSKTRPGHVNWDRLHWHRTTWECLPSITEFLLRIPEIASALSFFSTWYVLCFQSKRATQKGRLQKGRH